MNLKLNKMFLPFFVSLVLVLGFAHIVQAGYGGQNDRGNDNRSVKEMSVDTLKRMGRKALLDLVDYENDIIVRVGNFSDSASRALITALAVRKGPTLILLERMSRLEDKDERAKLLAALIKSITRQLKNAEAIYKKAGEELIKRNPKEYGGRYGLDALIWFPDRAKDKFEKNYVRLFLEYRDILWFRSFLYNWQRTPSRSP